MKRTNYIFDFTNTMKGKYKMFSLFPSLTVCRDTTCADLGVTAVEFYFEWFCFQVEFTIETTDEKVH